MASGFQCQAQNVYTDASLATRELGIVKRATIHFTRLAIYSAQDLKGILQEQAPGDPVYSSTRDELNLRTAIQAFTSDTIGVASVGFSASSRSRPYGLLVSEGKLVSPLDESPSGESVIPRPSGVLCVSRREQQMLLTIAEYKLRAEDCKFAVQGGPLFIRDTSAATNYGDGRRESRLLACQGQLTINHLFWIQSAALGELAIKFSGACERSLVIATGRHAGVILKRERSDPAGKPVFPEDAESSGSSSQPAILFILRK